VLRHPGQQEVTAVDELDELVMWARAYGPVPLPLKDWDHASIWGWDEAANSLFAELWRNTDDPAKPPTTWIGPDDFTPVTCPVTLTQHIAMAADCDPWKVATALFKVFDQNKDWSNEDNDSRANEAGTVVTMTEGDGIWWPPNFGSEWERLA
jgi:hypothetical protein